MLKTKKMLFYLLFVALLFPNTVFSAVMIPDSKGQPKPVNQITDIMRHVTGSTEKNLSVGKESLMIIREGKTSNNKVLISSDLYFFSNEGVNIVSGERTTDDLDTSFNWDFIRGIHPAVFNMSLNDGKKLTRMDTLANSKKTDTSIYPAAPNYDIFTQKISNDNQIKFSLDYNKTDTTNWKSPKAVYDRKAGLIVNGFNGELSCYVVADETTNYPIVRLGVTAVVKSSDATLKTYEAGNKTFQLNAENTPRLKGSPNRYYVATGFDIGDFNYDGYKNEIALVYMDMKNVYLKVLQVVHNGSNENEASFTINELSSSTVHTVNYSVDNTRLREMDGVGRITSAAVVTGDFDGDEKSEFAVVFRDYDGGQLYTEGGKIFPGLAGKVHVIIHKWNGSKFNSEETVKNFCSFQDNYEGNHQYKWDSTIGVKAVTADTNGDHRDEVVVMRFQLGFSWSNYDEYFNQVKNGYTITYDERFEIDVWDCGTSGIKPAEAWTLSKSKNGDKIVMNLTGDNGFKATDYQGTYNDILRVVTGNTVAYSFMERDCAIVAGKFTGRMGAGTTCDDLIVLYPTRKGNINTKTTEKLLTGHVRLITEIEQGKDYEKTDLLQIDDPYEFVGFVAYDYGSEGIELGAPTKIVSETQDRSYLAVLQAPPFHIDNLTEDGTKLQEQPRNFNYRAGTKVRYDNSNTDTKQNSVSFKMTKSLETIFALESESARTAVDVYKKVKGVTSSVLGNTLVQKIPGTNVINKKFSVTTGFIDKLIDSVTQTVEKTNQNTATTDIHISTATDFNDVLYVSRANQHIWRYPILTNPVPGWLVGSRTDSNGNFGGAKASNHEHFITFAVYDTPKSKTMFGIDDSRYQPFHENGNLFSYPRNLEEIDGYEDRTILATPLDWSGPAINQNISLTKLKREQQVVSKKVSKGIISETASLIDSLFKTSLVKVPSLGNPEPFNRTTKSTESLNINIPSAYSGARFEMSLEGYIDASGAMRVAFAVPEFTKEDEPWNEDSLYSKYPDPALILPQKFVYVQKADGSGKLTFEGFQGNKNDQTALEMKGVRFFAVDYGMNSSGLLLKGTKYRISVPVYNASFVDAEDVTVRLLYSKGNRESSQRTKIEDKVVNLTGWGNGDKNRQWVDFEWTPDLKDGTYYLFVEIDPDFAIENEVHKYRRAQANGNIVDYGGNNLGYVKISVASESSKIYDRTSLKSSFSSAAENDNNDDGGYITLNGIKDIQEFWDKYMASADAPVPVEVELILNDDLEEYFFPNAYVTAYCLNDGVSEAVKSGKEDPSDEDIYVYLAQEAMSFFPGEKKTFTFLLDPDPMYIKNGLIFDFELSGYDDPYADDSASDNDSKSSDDNSAITFGSSSGGCEMMSSGLALFAFICLLQCLKQYH